MGHLGMATTSLSRRMDSFPSPDRKDDGLIPHPLPTLKGTSRGFSSSPGPVNPEAGPGMDRSLDLHGLDSTRPDADPSLVHRSRSSLPEAIANARAAIR